MKPTILQKAAIHCSAGHLCNGCEFVHLTSYRQCTMRFAQAVADQMKKKEEKNG